jgi:MFS transporter, DHA1 family, 2-module integral membrane pump EmrD
MEQIKRFRKQCFEEKNFELFVKGTFMKNILFKPLLPSSTGSIVILILLIALVGFISMDIYFPSLPAISEWFHINQGTAQLTLTLFLCGFGFSQLFYGPLSDFFGRRPVLLIGFFIYLAATLLLISANNIQTLLIARLIQGIGAGAGASLCRVLLRDNFVGNKMAQVTSYLTVGIALATALAPALGGYIQQGMGFTGNFIVMLVFGGLVTLLVLFYLPETNKSIDSNSLHPINILKGYGSLLTNKIFFCNMLCSGFALSSLLAYAIINPFLLQDNLHLSPAHYGLVTLIIASGELVGTYINGRLVTKLGYKFMMFVGIGLMILAAMILLALNSLDIFTIPSIVVPTFIVTMSIGITIPNATAGAFSILKHSIGSAGAIYGFFQIVVTMLTTYLIACIAQQTQWHLGFIFLVLGLASLVVYSFVSCREKCEVISAEANQQ